MNEPKPSDKMIMVKQLHSDVEGLTLYECNALLVRNGWDLEAAKEEALQSRRRKDINID